MDAFDIFIFAMTLGLCFLNTSQHAFWLPAFSKSYLLDVILRFLGILYLKAYLICSDAEIMQLWVLKRLPLPIQFRGKAIQSCHRVHNKRKYGQTGMHLALSLDYQFGHLLTFWYFSLLRRICFLSCRNNALVYSRLFGKDLVLGLLRRVLIYA